MEEDRVLCGALLEPGQDPAQREGFLFFSQMSQQQVCLSRHLSVYLGQSHSPPHSGVGYHPSPHSTTLGHKQNQKHEVGGLWASVPVNSGQGPQTLGSGQSRTRSSATPSPGLGEKKHTEEHPQSCPGVPRGGGASESWGVSMGPFPASWEGGKPPAHHLGDVEPGAWDFPACSPFRRRHCSPTPPGAGYWGTPDTHTHRLHLHTHSPNPATRVPPMLTHNPPPGSQPTASCSSN